MAVKSETQTARQLFLYGAGDGKRIISVKALVEATGLHENTICKHLPKWSAEFEEMVANTSEKGLGLSLSAKELQLHKEDMIHLRGEIQKIKWEMKNLDSISSKLENWLDKFDGDDGEQDRALRILEAWQKNCGQISSLRSQFLALQKQWTTLSGVVDLKDVQVAREKTLATGRAKLDLKREENETGIRDSNGPLSSVFDRPSRPETIEG